MYNMFICWVNYVIIVLQHDKADEVNIVNFLIKTHYHKQKYNTYLNINR